MTDTATSTEVEKQEALPEQAAPPTLTPRQAIRNTIDAYKPVIRKLLVGTGVTEETFTAQLANAYRATPKLWQCEPETVLAASLKCAQLGLAPNDSRNLAWIIPYGKVAQFQIGYGGVMELARRAVPGLRFDGRPVYPNDEFDVDYGQPEPLTHRPAIAMREERGGAAFAWYVRAVFPDGSVQVHVLDREAVEYHRSFSKSSTAKDSMWETSYDAAALKSVVLDMKRWLPSSAQLVAAFASDEETLTVEALDDIDHEPTAEITEGDSQ